jgi:prepilin-type processing-associated H-X9-DG protein
MSTVKKLLFGSIFSRKEKGMNPQRKRKGNHFSFTLVELLTVIAIIIALAALLLPSLKSMREKMKSMACMNNLRQIHTAVCSYAQDNKGSVPPAIYWWRSLGDGGYCGNRDLSKKNTITNYGYMQAYPRWKVFRCPAEKGFKSTQTAGVTGPVDTSLWDNEYVNNSYFMNWSINGYDYYISSPPRKMSDTVGVAPGAAWFYIDGPIESAVSWYWNYWTWNEPNTPEYQYAFRHPGNKANVVFFDGHVGTRTAPWVCGKGVFVAIYPCDPSGFTFYNCTTYSNPAVYQNDGN